MKGTPVAEDIRRALLAHGTQKPETQPEEGALPTASAVRPGVGGDNPAAGRERTAVEDPRRGVVHLGFFLARLSMRV